MRQTSSRVVLVHHGTKARINNPVSLLNIDTLLVDNVHMNEANLDILSNITMTTDNIAYIIFTSGSTGIPKAVSRQHSTVLNKILLCASFHVGKSTTSKFY